MRVLWICNIMLPMIARRLGRSASNKEGWLAGLAGVLLERQQGEAFVLGVAFPVEKELDGCQGEIALDSGGKLFYYGFYEDVGHAQRYEEALEGRLKRIFQDFGPDVIHCFGTEYAHTLAAARACGRLDRLLVGIQGLCAVYTECYRANLPEAVWKSVTLRDWLKKDDLERQREKFRQRGVHEMEAIRLAGNVTGRTDWDRRFTREWNPKARYFAMNETLRAPFYHGGWKQEDCEPHSIFVSQGDYPIKGLHYLLLALPEIRDRYGDVKVYVAGDKVLKEDAWKERIKISAYGRYLRSILKEQGLKGQVEFLGRLDAEEMKKAYLRAGLFVCCSSVENSPNSLGEAMLLGMPCVSADVGGIPSLFRDGTDGILYKGYQGLDEEAELSRIVGELRDAVLALFEDPGQAARYGEAAREHALRTHDPEANYRRVLEIYQEIARGGEA